MENKNCVLISNKEYKELKDKVVELENKVKPDVIEIILTDMKIVDVFDSYWPSTKHISKTTIDLSEGVFKQVRNIASILKEDYEKKIEAHDKEMQQYKEEIRETLSKKYNDVLAEKIVVGNKLVEALEKNNRLNVIIEDLEYKNKPWYKKIF